MNIKAARYELCKWDTMLLDYCLCVCSNNIACVVGILTYIALLLFVTRFDLMLQMTQPIVTTVNSSVSRPTTIPRAMLASLEEETRLMYSVVPSSVCSGVTTTVTVVYTVDVTVVVPGKGHIMTRVV